MDLIPLYRADKTLEDWISPAGLERLTALFLIDRVVRNRKGVPVRAYRRSGEGEARALEVEDYQGKRYSYRQRLPIGKKVWALKKLGKGNELQPIFTQVVADCLVSQ